jgi:hypothetical protein
MDLTLSAAIVSKSHVGVIIAPLSEMNSKVRERNERSHT